MTSNKINEREQLVPAKHLIKIYNKKTKGFSRPFVDNLKRPFQYWKMGVFYIAEGNRYVNDFVGVYLSKQVVLNNLICLANI